MLLCLVINGKGNPYKNILDIQSPLPNLLTKTVVNEVSWQKILNVLKTVNKEYLSFRNVQCIGRSRKFTVKQFLRLSPFSLKSSEKKQR